MEQKPSSNQANVNVTQNIYGNSGTIIGHLAIYGSPDLTPKLSDITRTQLLDGSYQHEAVVSVDTPHPLTEITFIARAPSIKSFKVDTVVPQAYGMSEGYFNVDHTPFVTLRNSSGPWKLKAITAKEDQVKFEAK